MTGTTRNWKEQQRSMVKVYHNCHTTLVIVNNLSDWSVIQVTYVVAVSFETTVDETVQTALFDLIGDNSPAAVVAFVWYLEN